MFNDGLIRNLGLLSVLTILQACGGNSSSDIATSAPPVGTGVRVQLVADGFSSPVFMASIPGDATRLFVVEQPGRIRIVDSATGLARATSFLDISASVRFGGEEGLLGLAFDPDYTTNRRFYVFHTNGAGNLVISRYFRSATDPNVADISVTVLLTISHPGQTNHNGGMLAFGNDGCLYAATGDGGGGGDPNNNAQNTNSLLGKILRIDPDSGTACNKVIANPFSTGGGAAEVWSFGLRNPWRFSFDRLTGDLYIGDVGQGKREEVNVATGANPGRGINYGWRRMEGFACFNPSINCNTGSLTLPALDYDRAGGACSVIGGYVYRGAAIPALRGRYLYAVFCAGFVRSFRFSGGAATEETQFPTLSPPGGFVTGFGEDSVGELYLVSQTGGLWKMVPG